MNESIEHLKLRRSKARVLVRLCKSVLAANSPYSQRVHTIREWADMLGFVGDGQVLVYAQACIDDCTNKICLLRGQLRSSSACVSQQSSNNHR
jgi:hypothetical protein